MILLNTDTVFTVASNTVKLPLADQLDPVITGNLRMWLLNALYPAGAMTAISMRFY